MNRKLRAKYWATMAVAAAIAGSMVAGAGRTALAAGGVWNSPTGGTWGDAGNWTAGIPGTAGDVPLFGSALLTSGSITLDGSRTLGGLLFDNANASYVLVPGAGGILLMDNNGSAATFTVNSGVHEIRTGVQFLVSPLTFTVAGGSSLLMSGNVSGSGDISMSGAGVLMLAGNNSYVNTTITTGKLIIGNGGAGGNLGTGSVTLSGQGSLAFNRSSPYVVGNAISGAGSVTQMGSGSLTLTGSSSYSGATTLLGNTVLTAQYSQVAANVLPVSSALVLNTGATMSFLAAPGSANAQTITGQITLGDQSVFNITGAAGGGGGGVGTMNFNASGATTAFNGLVTVNVTGAGSNASFGIQNYAGLTRFNVGTGAVISTSNALPTAPGNGAVDISGNGTVLTTLTNFAGTVFSPYVTINSRDWATSNGTTISAISSYVNDAWTGGDTTVTTNSFIANSSVNTLRFATAANTTVTLSGSNVIAGGGILVTPDVGAHTSTITGGILRSTLVPKTISKTPNELVLNQMNTAGDLVINSSIMNNANASVSVVKLGPGTALLGNADIIGSPGTVSGYSGPTRIVYGTLKLGNGGALSRGQLSVSSDGLLDLNGLSAVAGPLGGNGVIDNLGGGNVTLTSYFATGFQAGFLGSIRNSTGTTNLTITGSGFLSMSGANLYTGQTTIHRTSVTLDFSQAGAPLANILSPNSTLVLQGGNLTNNPSTAANTSQTLAGLVVDRGASTITNGSNSTAMGSLLNVGAISRNAGGTLAITLRGNNSIANRITTTASNDASGILGGWAVSANSWVTVTGGFLSFLGSEYSPNLLGPNLHTDVTGSFTANDTTTATLRFAGAGATLTLAGPTLLQSGGILIGDGTSGNATRVTGGSITSGNGQDLIITTNQNRAASFAGLTIQSPITDNGNVSIALTKSGGGLLALAGNNTFTGPLYLSAGVLQFVSGGSIPAAATIYDDVNTTGGSGGIILYNGQNLPNPLIATTGTTEVFTLDASNSVATFSGNLTVPADSPDQYRMGISQGTLVLTGTHTAGSPNAGTAAVTPMITRGNIIYAGNASLNVFNAPMSLGASNNVNLTFTDNATFHSNVDPGVEAMYVASPFASSSTTTITLKGNASVTLGSTGAGILNLHKGGQPSKLTLGGNSQLLLGGISLSNGSTVINFDGGTLVAGQDNPNFIPSLDVKTNIEHGGVRFDTQAFNDTIATVLSFDPSGDGGGLAKLGTGQLTLTGKTTYHGPTTIAGGTLVFAGGASDQIAGVSGPGKLELAANTSLISDGIAASAWALDANANATIRSNGSAAGTSKVSTLTLAGSLDNWQSTLNLTNNALILQSLDTTSKAIAFSIVQNQIASGNHGGDWLGAGITSSTITANTTLTLLDNAALHLSTYRGQTVDDNSLIIVQSPLGDGNGDGKVNSLDLTTLANHWQQQSGATAATGDYNGDGKVDSLDLTIVANNWQFGGAGLAAGGGLQASLSQVIAQPAGPTPIPEPATALLLGAFLPALLKRRRPALRRSSEKRN